MKKLINLILAIVLVMTLAACQLNTLVGNTNLDLSAGNTDIPPDAATSDISTPLPPKAIVDSITYVNHGSEYLPVSYVDGGVQLLMGYEGEWYEWRTEVNNRIKDAPRAGSLNTVNANDMYLNSKPEYEGIPAVIFNFVASTGDWDLFPVKVRYKKYTLNNQPDCKEWIDYFGEKLAAVSPDTPVVFAEAFFFDWNMDGKGAVLVVASNRILHYGNKTESVIQNPPPADNTTSYDMSALFIIGNEPLSLCDDIYSTLSNEPLSVENSIYESYLPPLKGSKLDWYENPYSFVQLDANGRLIECPVFSCGETGYANKTMVLLCDIDGNGRPELLTMQAVIYAPIIVYKLIDGKPQEAFRINTGA